MSIAVGRRMRWIVVAVLVAAWFVALAVDAELSGALVTSGRVGPPATPGRRERRQRGRDDDVDPGREAAPANEREGRAAPPPLDDRIREACGLRIGRAGAALEEGSGR